eukprot:COSAG01_NODE_52583_length_345_cov_2.321138_1_plen_23_part_01
MARRVDLFEWTGKKLPGGAMFFP